MLLIPEFSLPTRLQRLQGDVWNQRGIQVFMKREDERDAVLGGNKWCKLMGHLELARADNVQRLISVGGLWSNHLHALAYAGQRYGFATTGLVRAEAPGMNAMLHEVQAAGMQIRFVSREDFRLRHDPEWQQRVCAELGGGRFIAEGGAGFASRLGLSMLADEMTKQIEGPAMLALPVGSGTTLAGLRSALPSRISVCGFQAFSDSALSSRMTAAISNVPSSWSVQPTLAMGSHARLPAVLLDFMQSFECEEKIALDPVYTVRMMARLCDLIRMNALPDGSQVVALHTGGLQGRRGHLSSLAA